MLVKCVLLLLCYHLLVGGAVSEFISTVYPAKIMSSSQCGKHNTLHDEQLRQALQPIKQHISNQCTTSNHLSCKSILDDNPSAPSGYYNINTVKQTVDQVYCDMEGTHCGGEGGWTRVTHVDMTQAGATCPQGLEQMSFNGSPYCGRFSSGVGCSSAFLDTTIRYVDEWLDTRIMVLGHLTILVLMEFTLMEYLSHKAVLVSTYDHMLLGLLKERTLHLIVHVTMEIRYYANLMYILVNVDSRMEIRESVIVAEEGLGYPTASNA